MGLGCSPPGLPPGFRLAPPSSPTAPAESPTSLCDSSLSPLPLWSHGHPQVQSFTMLCLNSCRPSHFVFLIPSFIYLRLYHSSWDVLLPTEASPCLKSPRMPHLMKSPPSSASPIYLRTLISCQAGCFFNFQLSTCIVFFTAFPTEFFCSEWLLSLSLLVGVLAVLQGPP